MSGFELRDRAPYPNAVARAAAVVMLFGKYKGKTLGDIVKLGPEGLLYIDWLIGQEIRNVDLLNGLRVIHAKYSDEIDRAMEERER